MTSAELATCLMTNPVVVRRVMGDLRRAGLVSSAKGHNGGWSLVRPPDAISLRDVYAALGERLLVRTETAEGSPTCQIVRAVNSVMADVLDDAEALLAARLSRMSLADLSLTLPSKDHSHV